MRITASITVPPHFTRQLGPRIDRFILTKLAAKSHSELIESFQPTLIIQSERNHNQTVRHVFEASCLRRRSWYRANFIACHSLNFRH